MTPSADCAHCTHSRAEWTGAGSGVVLLCDLGFRIRKPPHDCGSYQREPGAYDNKGETNRGPW